VPLRLSVEPTTPVRRWRCRTSGTRKCTAGVSPLPRTRPQGTTAYGLPVHTGLQRLDGGGGLGFGSGAFSAEGIDNGPHGNLNPTSGDTSRSSNLTGSIVDRWREERRASDIVRLRQRYDLELIGGSTRTTSPSAASCSPLPCPAASRREEESWQTQYVTYAQGLHAKDADPEGYDPFEVGGAPKSTRACSKPDDWDYHITHGTNRPQGSAAKRSRGARRGQRA